MKGNYTIHNLWTLHACFGHYEYNSLCQVDKGYTTPHRCVTVNDSKRNQPSDRD